MNRRRLWPLVALQAASVALAGWVATGEALWVVLAAPAAFVGALTGGGEDRRIRSAAGVLLLGVVAVLAAHLSLDRLSRGWTERSEEAEARSQTLLAEAVDSLLSAGETATDRLAELAARAPLVGADLPPGIRPEGVDALAFFGPSGELIAWDGSHQGPVPAEVRGAADRYSYREGALFGYLYVTRPVAGDGAAVAATLLRAELPASLGPPVEDFRSRFERATGARIEVSPAERALGERVFDIGWEDRVLVSITLLPASEGDARARRQLGWMRAVTVLLLVGWVLSLLGARRAPGTGLVAGATLSLLVVVLPIGRLVGLAGELTPADFLLAGPLALTIVDVLALGLGGALLVGLLPPRPGRRLHPAAASIAGVGLVAVVLALAQGGASRDFLARGEPGWIVFQGAVAALALAILAAAAALSREGRPDDGPRPLLLAASALLAGALALGWVAFAGRPLGTSAALSLLWVGPLYGVVVGSSGGAGWSRPLARHALLALLSSSLVLPWAWNLRVEARIAVAEERVERLGTRPDPFLEFLLQRLGDAARTLASEGRGPVEVLYGGWTDSGLAAEGVPVWLTYWSPDGRPQDELRIGVTGTRPPLRGDLPEGALARGAPVVTRFDLADTHYVGVTPLERGAYLTAIVPPRRILEGSSPLGPLFSPARGVPDPLVLIPVLPGEVPGTTEGIEWIRTPEGWQGETYLAYPDEVYHAHYVVEAPGWILRFARGTLLVFLNVGVLTLLWTVGRWLRRGGGTPVVGWASSLGTFRGRVTLALFAFFLVPSVLFGTMAYRTLSAAAVRAADSLATRAAEDAASWFVEVEGAMDVLAGRVGSDLLLYRGGELVGGSTPELLELGLYEGWLPPDVNARMRTGEDLVITEAASLGGWEYVVAYRRIPGSRTLAAPAPLQAGATALRQRDVADLLGFSIVVGAALSTLLALLVGRALARPIQTLRVGSERVGAGNMAVRLPEGRSDEFGAVFDAFNRMVDRLAGARRALLRSSRRTRAIVEEVATGVIALDRGGRVRLANPRAEQLIGAAIADGEGLPAGRDPTDGRDALVAWVERCYAEGIPEAAEDFTLGSRRVRVRARRISRRGPRGGLVLALEDVTDELRTERILAWGEVAQQVAHEVKNPLTPMKLGVQHIRRAWEDGRDDYGEILDRNVDAILEEIDRLASVASSFSRFAAPTEPGEALEPVRVEQVAGEVLDLYRAGEGPVRFELDAETGLPPVRARAGEMKEVLVNLLENARTALPSGGTVRVEASPAETGVEVRVRDDGTGIAPDLLPRVFEPHFSTRSGGTGLGLAIVRRLVESWGGSVRAESRPGAGTVIRISLASWNGADGSADPTARG